MPPAKRRRAERLDELLAAAEADKAAKAAAQAAKAAARAAAVAAAESAPPIEKRKQGRPAQWRLRVDAPAFLTAQEAAALTTAGLRVRYALSARYVCMWGGCVGVCVGWGGVRAYV